VYARSQRLGDFDEVLELLHLGGRSLPARGADDDPEAWENNADMDPGAAGFLRVPLVLMEPGRPGVCRFHRRHPDRRRSGPQRPAAGPLVADPRRPRRAGQRGRWLEIDPAGRGAKAALRPGRCSWSTPHSAGSSRTTQIKAALAAEAAVRRMVACRTDPLEKLPEREHITLRSRVRQRRQQTFGYTEEELRSS